MLSLKDMLYVKKLRKEGYLTATSKEIKGITEEDLRKIKLIKINDPKACISLQVLKEFCEDDLPVIMCSKFFNWEEVVYLKSRRYDLREFANNIYPRCSRKNIKYIKAMCIGPCFHVFKILFLLDNNMLYRVYSKEYDYKDFFMTCKEIGLDYTNERLTRFSVDFIKFLGERYTSEECTKLLEVGFRLCIEVSSFEDICKFLIEKTFTFPEMMFVLKKIKNNDQALKSYFNYGGTKEGLLRYLYLNEFSN